jgi:sarcosine oxidase subunit delta
MRIDCPYCGTRDLSEFTYLGAAVTRPPGDAPLDAWIDYVYLRDNPDGPLRERWYHTAGCRSWLAVMRDTRTHEILRVSLSGAEEDA